jgi:hypothetical protein
MTDQELDEILDTWTAPDIPTTLRPRTLSRFGPKHRPPIFRRVLIATAFAATLLLAVEAIPQSFTPQPPPPFTVESAFDRFTRSGAHRIQMFSTSYNDSSGMEITLSRWLPGNTMGTAVRNALDAVTTYYVGLVGHLHPQLAQRNQVPRVRYACGDDGCLSALSRAIPWLNPSTGCVTPERILSRETILGYSTVAARISGDADKKITAWLAPELNCFALRITTEDQQADGSLQLTWVKQAIKVTVNR